MPSILDLNNLEARAYFLEDENYCNFDRPKYFNFNNILQKTAEIVADHEITVLCATPYNSWRPYYPGNFEKVNYRLLSNKDGDFGWRPFELIHPALYTSLVHKITTSDHWDTLKARFRQFRDTGVICESMPFKSEDQDSHKAKQIKNWWGSIEQRSLELGLEYEFVFDADISDCYGSIYTHSIAWAVHTKEIAKEKRRDKNLIGNIIDKHIQMMRHDQTNGIPQGSVLMDFIAEIVLGYIDLDLSVQLKDMQGKYKILRYRDDYRVFTNNSEDGRKIIKCLSELLAQIGMKLNTEKTRQKADPIIASIKDDKLDELFIPNNKNSLQKQLLQIYLSANKHPNSGKIIRMLNRYYDVIDRAKHLGRFDNPHAMISIITNLALKNPKSHPWSMAILSKLLDFCSEDERLSLIIAIKKKFDRIPNTGLLDIWLQRISYKISPRMTYKEQLTDLVGSSVYPGNFFWESSWLRDDLRKIVTFTSVIDKGALDGLPNAIERNEVELFKPLIIS